MDRQGRQSTVAVENPWCLLKDLVEIHSELLMEAPCEVSHMELANWALKQL